MAKLLGLGLSTLQRCWRQFAGDGDRVDRRKGSHHLVSYRLTDEERQLILLTCNQSEFAALPPGQILPALADRGGYIGSELNFYRVLHAHGQAHRRGRVRPPQEPRPLPRLEARLANQLLSWDHLPAHHRAATLEAWLEELDVLRYFSRPRVSNANPYSESRFRTVNRRPDYPRRPLRSQDQACSWTCAFVNWYNHPHRHSRIRIVTPDQRHSGQANAICRQRARL